MGWLSNPNWQNKKELVQHLIEPTSWHSNQQIVKHCVKGNNLWLLVEVVSGEQKGRLFIALYMMSYDEGEWGYKEFSESSGPCKYDCPLRFIAAVNANVFEPSKMASQWREKVKAYHQRRKDQFAKRASLTEGTEVILYGKGYRLKKPLGRSGWQVASLTDNGLYKMTIKQLNMATIAAASQG